jgi:hypothetical protein
MPRRRRRDPDHRSLTRDILASLAMVVVIFVSFVALPLGQAHGRACALVSTLASRPDMPCGLAALSITIDTERHPFLSITIHPLRVPISL